MPAPSASDVQQYYKWTTINLVGVIVIFILWQKVLPKKYGIMGLGVLSLIFIAGTMYFQYKDGYIPLHRRSWMY